MWLPCTVNVQDFGVQICRFHVDLLEMSQIAVIWPKICFRWKPTFHTVLCSCMWIVHVTLCAVELQSNSTKCPGNALSIPGATCSEQLLRESSFSQVAISLLVWSFCPMIWLQLWQIYCGHYCDSHARIFIWKQKQKVQHSSCLMYTLIADISHFTCSTVHVYTFHRTRFQWFQIGIGTVRGWNYHLAVLCQDLGLLHTFGCCFVNCRGGLMRWTISGFLVLLGWAPCQVGIRPVELAGLSSKSTCNLCVVFGLHCAVLASAFLCPVCSISWLGSSREEGPIPIGELEQIDLMCVFKVGDICWLILKQVRCRM